MTTTSSNYILTIFFAHFLPLCVDVVSGDQFSSEKEDTLVQTSYVLTQKGVGVTLLNERERERANNLFTLGKGGRNHFQQRTLMNEPLV